MRDMKEAFDRMKALEHQRFVNVKRAARMEKIDHLPAPIRELIHAYGYNVVKAFMDCGVGKANHIRHLVETVLDEFSPTRGTFSNQGVRAPLIDSQSRE